MSKTAHHTEHCTLLACTGRTNSQGSAGQQHFSTHMPSFRQDITLSACAHFLSSQAQRTLGCDSLGHAHMQLKVTNTQYLAKLKLRIPASGLVAVMARCRAHRPLHLALHPPGCLTRTQSRPRAPTASSAHRASCAACAAPPAAAHRCAAPAPARPAIVAHNTSTRSL